MKLAYCANSHINGALWRYTDRIRTVPFMQISGLFFLNGSKITKYSLFVRYAKYSYNTVHTHVILHIQYITYIIQAYCALRRSILCILYIIILSLICFFPCPWFRDYVIFVHYYIGKLKKNLHMHAPIGTMMYLVKLVISLSWCPGKPNIIAIVV